MARKAPGRCLKSAVVLFFCGLLYNHMILHGIFHGIPRSTLTIAYRLQPFVVHLWDDRWWSASQSHRLEDPWIVTSASTWAMSLFLRACMSNYSAGLRKHRFRSTKEYMYSLVTEDKIAIENGPCIVEIPSEDGDFPQLCKRLPEASSPTGPIDCRYQDEENFSIGICFGEDRETHRGQCQKSGYKTMGIHGFSIAQMGGHR